MRLSCPTCRKSEFSYRALLSVHPYPGEFSPSRIDCPSCGAALRITARTRFIAGFVFVGSAVGTVLVLGWLSASLQQWQVVTVIAAVFAMYHFVFWPALVRLKPWTPFQYWLPKSRVVGYTVYLVAPVALIATLLYLAITIGADA